MSAEPEPTVNKSVPATRQDVVDNLKQLEEQQLQLANTIIACSDRVRGFQTQEIDALRQQIAIGQRKQQLTALLAKMEATHPAAMEESSVSSSSTSTKRARIEEYTGK